MRALPNRFEKTLGQTVGEPDYERSQLLSQSDSRPISLKVLGWSLDKHRTAQSDSAEYRVAAIQSFSCSTGNLVVSQITQSPTTVTLTVTDSESC